MSYKRHDIHHVFYRTNVHDECHIKDMTFITGFYHAFPYNVGMVTNEREIVSTLLGKSFQQEHKLVGHDVEAILGSTPNSRREADLGDWEVKSREVGATSRITLGGLKNVSPKEREAHVYDKIKNLILVKYIRNSNGTFRVVRIYALSGLELSSFQVSGYEFDPHHRNSSLRITENKLMKMYQTNIVYDAPDWALE